MASQTFSFTSGTGGESTAVTVGAGESVRVRLTSRVGTFKLQLKIVANATTSYIDIDEKQAWATGAVIEGDEVSVVCTADDGADSCAGIIETFA